MNLNSIIALYEQPSDWPKVAAALTKLHNDIQGKDEVSIANIVKENVVPALFAFKRAKF